MSSRAVAALEMQATKLAIYDVNCTAKAALPTREPYTFEDSGVSIVNFS
jgi:hypothetical protein